jgi:CPA2 family monovalent cation:H+ antiporter-2
LESIGKDVCLVDLSQINLHPFALEGFRTVAGDATDRATLEHAEVGGAAFVAVCVPDDGAAIRVVRAVRRLNRGCYLVVRCRYHASESPLRKAGADRVVTEETEASLKLLATIRDMNHASATASQD